MTFRILLSASASVLFLFPFQMALAQKAPENLLQNSDMDGSGKWKGDRKFMKESDIEKKDQKEEKEKKAPLTEQEKLAAKNRILKVKASTREIAEFDQEIDTKKLTTVTIRFRYKTSNYTGHGLKITGTRDDDSYTYRDYDLKADNQWHSHVWKFSEIRGSRKLNITFKVLEGIGEVYFDDITAEVPKLK